MHLSVISWQTHRENLLFPVDFEVSAFIHRPSSGNSKMLMLVILIAAYLVGSFPTAYFVVKRISKVDIRAAGSGNVGGFNAYEVSGRRSAGILVAAVDVFKGAVVTWLVLFYVPGSPLTICGAFLAVVVGHCFPIWLKFRGGRGLATAAGALAVIAWPFVGIWLFGWLVTYVASDHIHLGNVVGTAFMLVASLILQDSWLAAIVRPEIPLSYFRILMLALSIILLVRHIEPMKLWIQEYQRS
jgi:glycerol-3-phosphate acyltransferase PlsY